MRKVPIAVIAALAAVLLTLIGASTALADPPFPNYSVTAQPGDVKIYDVAAENPSLGVTQVQFVLAGPCFQTGLTTVQYTEYNTTVGYSDVCKIVVAYNGGQGVADFIITVGSPDTVEPVVTITSPTDGSTVTTNSVTLNYTVSDNVDPSLTCDQTNGSSIPLNVGTNTITVNCTDAAGNTGSSTVNVTRTPPDTEKPVVTIMSPVDGTTFTVNTATLTFGVTDNQDQIPTCDKISGNDVTLAIGSNTITVNCTDEAGNTGSASVNVTYTPPVAQDRVKIKLGNVTIREGDTNRVAYVPITLSAAYGVPITLSYKTQQVQGRGGATSGVDYVAVEDSVTIPAGEKSWEIPITIIGDNLKESSENFFVIGDLAIESDAYAILVKDKATVVITNDDNSGCNDGHDHNHNGHDDNHDGQDDGHDGHDG